MQQKRFLLFVISMVLLIAAWWALGKWVLPQKPPGTDETSPSVRDGALHVALGPWDLAPVKELIRKRAEQAAKPIDFGIWDLRRLRAWALAKKPEPKPGTTIALGSKDPQSKYHLAVELTSRGAGVDEVMLNKFQATDHETGKPKRNELLTLVPKNKYKASNLLYHFTREDASKNNLKARPLATLGLIDWKPSGAEAEEDTLSDGRQRQRISFTTDIDGVEITKVYTLVEQEYHIELEVRIRRTTGVKGERKFRYQLTGSQGLPIEGRWYTSTFRNALIGTVDAKGNVYRDLQDLRQIGLWQGGSDVVPPAEQFIRYAGIANQYFASVIVVEKDQKYEKSLIHARPTLERGLAKGKIESLSSNGDALVLVLTKELKETFYLDELPPAQRQSLVVGADIALWHHTDPEYRLDSYGEPRELATDIQPDPAKYHPQWEDDITVRVATGPIDLKDDETEVQKYLLYNGPVKPRLLGYMKGDSDQVAPDLVDRYEDLGLNTMTDFHSPGVLGRIASTIYWTDLVIKCTNVMHWVLNKIHWLIPSYGLSIICLTVLVRGMMFPISRKGALTSLRMQELAPELKKLQEKHKDDKQGMQLAQMELYRKHGVNPFGTCWFMFLQMPIFMGLYYALQESITFRLASFWPTWIDNLAAPDMLFEWGQSIPWLSTPESYGGFLYLGPYLNLLPFIAVALMIMQQKLVTPPPTDEQQEMQQKMMKYMMAFMGLMFYKVAAGLCLYFIASSLWGFAERKLLPKKKPLPTEGTTPTTSASLFSRILGGGAQTDAGSTAVTTELPGRGKGRMRRGKERPSLLPEEPEEGGSPLQRLSRWFRRKRDGLSHWWAEVLKQAAKKER